MIPHPLTPAFVRALRVEFARERAAALWKEAKRLGPDGQGLWHRHEAEKWRDRARAFAGEGQG